MSFVGKCLDCTTGMLTQGEMNTIAEAPPRVIVHEYGAWVSVEHEDPEGIAYMDEEFEEDGTFPNLHAVLKHARDLRVNWINFDRDGTPIEGLPVHNW